MYFCEDVDLLPWEPGIFFDPAFAHQGIVKDANGTLTGTALVMDAAALANVLPGMVAQVVTSGGLSQLLEVTAIADASHATLSALRGRESEGAVPALAGGAAKVSVTTFRPQIAAVGDGLLALVGITADRASDPAPASAQLAGFRTACIFGTLAAIFRTLATAQAASTITFAKKTFYDKLATASRRAISATIDVDGDGTPETPVRADVPALDRI